MWLFCVVTRNVNASVFPSSPPPLQAWGSYGPILYYMVLWHTCTCATRILNRWIFSVALVVFRSWSTIWRASWAVTSRTPLSRWWRRCQSSTPRSCTTPLAAWEPTRRLLPRSWARSATEVSAPYPWSTKKVMYYRPVPVAETTSAHHSYTNSFVSFHSVRQIPGRRFEVRHVGIVQEIAGVVVLREYTTNRA